MQSMGSPVLRRSHPSLSRHRTCIRQQSCRRPTDFGGGVACVVDLVDFWDRRGGSAVSSDVVGARAVVTFLCCSAVRSRGVWYSLPGPKPCAWCCCSFSRENSSKSWCDAWSLCRVRIVFIISGRSSLEDRCRPGRWSVLQGVHVAGAGCQSSPPLLESSGSSSSPLSAASCGFLGSSGTFSWYFTFCWLMTYNRGSMKYFVDRLY
eukprot:g12291.t1